MTLGLASFWGGDRLPWERPGFYAHRLKQKSAALNSVYRECDALIESGLGAIDGANRL